jgi:hypothetical protein
MPCPGILGCEKPCSGFALRTVLSPPQFGRGTFATQSPVTRPNRQLSRTLCEIKPKFITKVLTKILKHYKNNQEKKWSI